MNKQLRLDEDDFHILHELQVDSSQSLSTLSTKLHLPKSTIHARMKKLGEKGVIERQTIRINTELLGFEMLAFIMINFDQHYTNLDQEEVAKKIAKIPLVEEVHLIAGEWDILIKVRTRGINELGDFSVKKLKTVEGLGKSLTFVVLKNIKDSNSAQYPFLIDTLLL